MQITIDYAISRYTKNPSKTAIDITCKASGDSDIDSKIFVMQKLSKNTLGQQTYRFSHVADPVDLQDWPDCMQDDYSYFRTDQITLRVRSQFQAQSIIKTMQEQVKSLVQALKFLNSDKSNIYTFSQTFS